ncbi:MAG: hypothetical protein Q7N95_08065, partial [Alphaproteobacteria bacterium]|nr:hypothetical protein [Alphaproteobacteria bacterium]
NLGSALVERPLADLADARLCQAMTLAAVCSQQLWQRIGTWVHDERALYLRALVASALGHATEALAHAEAGLALIDAHDSADEQTVDRAFLSLEAAFALQRLGRRDEAAKHHACADRLAAGFGDSGLQTWFADRAARNQLLSR